MYLHKNIQALLRSDVTAEGIFIYRHHFSKEVQAMPRMSKKKRLEMSFYINHKGRIEHKEQRRPFVFMREVAAVCFEKLSNRLPSFNKQVNILDNVVSPRGMQSLVAGQHIVRDVISLE